MEDHITSSSLTGPGNGSVTMATDSARTIPDLRDLCGRVKFLEQKAGSVTQFDSYMWNSLLCDGRVRQLEKSERSLLQQLNQLTPSMHHSQRLDQRLHILREEVRNMTQEKERDEQVWRERLQRVQKQLKAKEEEMSRQSQYFENFKIQLQQKLSLAQDREQSFQKRIYMLEKQLLDMTVSAATGIARIGAVRVTAGTITCWEQQERLTFVRGEGEGEEEKREEKRKQWQPSVGIKREGRREGDEGKTELEVEEGRSKDTRQSPNEARLQGFILSLQEDLRVLLEREEDGMTERRKLMEHLQEAEENGHFLGCKVEQMEAEVQQLKLSERSLVEEVKGLRDENNRLKSIFEEAASQSPHQSSTCLCTSSARCSTAVCPVPPSTLSRATAMTRPSVWSLGQVQPSSDEEEKQSCSSTVSLSHHQTRAQSNTDGNSSSAKLDTLNQLVNQGSKPNTCHQSLTLTSETVSEVKMGTWFSRGVLNLEESPSEESDALREAYRNLGFQDELEPPQELSLDDALHHTQQEHTELRNEAKEETDAEQKCPGEKDDLVQALNQENRALADKIQQLLTHIELREQEVKKEESQMRKHISSLEEDRARLKQDNEEQGGLITELTRKTEDDLNTIMDMQQKLKEIREQHQEECVDSLVESVLRGEEAPLISSQQIDELKRDSALEPQHSKHSGSPENNQPTNTLHLSSITDHEDQLMIQTLKTEQKELLSNLNSLREQHRDVAQAVHAQTEEKQQLTRTVWSLKEEKDKVSQALTGLKQEKEELNRTVVSLKDQLVKSTKGLKEEKEQLTAILSGLQRQKQELMESLSSGREEQSQIKLSVQSLQRESNQLMQEVLNQKRERDDLINCLKFLKEQRDQEELFLISQDDHNQLIKSVNSLREEQQQTAQSISCLKQEEKQISLEILHLREERSRLQPPLPPQTQTESKPEQQLSHPVCVDNTTRTEALHTEYATQSQTDTLKGTSTQEQSDCDLMLEINVLGEQLQRSQEELEKTRAETKALLGELSQSEVKREEAERRTSQADEKATRLTVAVSQMEETRMENQKLSTQVRELQGKLTDVVREKTATLSLKQHVEEKYSVLTAQLKAKTVALEELNNNYVELKRWKSSNDDLSTVVTSLQTRYNDIRAKYDALLRRQSHTDLDVAPLKAKLLSLVAKCHERNGLLVQMTKAMRRRGCGDPALAQQVERLLRDAALQDYTAAFAAGSGAETCDRSSGRVLWAFLDYAGGSAPDLKCLQACSGDITRGPVSPTPAASLEESLSAKSPAPASEPAHLTRGPEEPGFQNSDVKGRSTPYPTDWSRSAPAPSSSCVGVSRRLSSPEKIINLHEQLQKTLMSSYEAPVSRGRGHQPRKSLSLSAPINQRPQNVGLIVNRPQTNSPAVTTASVQERTKPNGTTSSTALFKAVSSRSAHLTLNPNLFTNPPFKADESKTTLSAHSGSTKSIASSGSDSSGPPTPKEVTDIAEVSDTTHSASPLTQRATSFDSNILLCSETNPKATASDTTASKMDGAAYDGFISAASLTHSHHCSPESSNKSAAPEKTSRPKPAPADVCSVEVIQTVGQSSLLIGWERPPLDELGCSNGTFVYGYRVFVDGDFHKSVMSSACTKCILENVDLSVPVHIGVQTLGSNGIASNTVHTTYMGEQR
ncbi:early endosome antigen 1-like isoform X2 [Betta splendens]|uniref:Early endosome antigen 1-like isoform X2 n=1 Tax=Betta splendens TaxID=158456 RepID=A0A9W2Y3G9_BETSP|nr:early endosome antigen 1-like isoform X2 [Betta splendens]